MKKSREEIKRIDRGNMATVKRWQQEGVNGEIKREAEKRENERKRTGKELRNMCGGCRRLKWWAGIGLPLGVITPIVLQDWGWLTAGVIIWIVGFLIIGSHYCPGTDYQPESGGNWSSECKCSSDCPCKR